MTAVAADNEPAERTVFPWTTLLFASACFFAGAGIGSVLGGWTFAKGGWPLTAWVGFAFSFLALAYFATE